MQAGSSAEAAGLRGTQVDRFGSVIPGDVVVGVEGRPVSDVASLFSVLDEYEVGDEVEVTINRSGREITTRVTLEPGR